MRAWSKCNHCHHENYANPTDTCQWCGGVGFTDLGERKRQPGEFTALVTRALDEINKKARERIINGK